MLLWSDKLMTSRKYTWKNYNTHNHWAMRPYLNKSIGKIQIVFEHSHKFSISVITSSWLMVTLWMWTWSHHCHHGHVPPPVHPVMIVAMPSSSMHHQSCHLILVVSPSLMLHSHPHDHLVLMSPSSLYCVCLVIALSSAWGVHQTSYWACWQWGQVGVCLITTLVLLLQHLVQVRWRWTRWSGHLPMLK